MMKLISRFIPYLGYSMVIFLLAGCQTPTAHRQKADKVAEDIIKETSKQALGHEQEINIEKPGDILRRRLLQDQDLPYVTESLGSDQLKPLKNWPEKNYPVSGISAEPNIPVEKDMSITLTLEQALEVGAHNSFDYQAQKENVFESALSLDLERNNFRNIFFGQFQSQITSDTTSNRARSGASYSADTGVTRLLENGADISSALAVDLANLFTGGGASSLGLAGDTTISIPLLRGSGRFIVTESLTQAQRNVVYAMYNFEQFKKNFAVDIADEYLSVLGLLDEVKNSEENYRSLIASTRRSRRLADAGRITPIEVDQAFQNELRSRDRWIRSIETYKIRLDSFKSRLGLPPDALIDLDRAVLDKLMEPTQKIMQEIVQQETNRKNLPTPPADAPITLAEPNYANAGPLEIPQDIALQLAFDNRLDFRAVQGSVYDAQRAVVVAADALRGELTLFGSAQFGENRSISQAELDNAHFSLGRANLSGLLTLDLPIERTRERNNYRESFIKLEQAVRNVQSLEDRIKLAILNELRNLMQTRESLYIQAESVYVAEKRVRSVNLYLEAGRAQMRDLLDAQESLLSAQNALTGAVVDYRIAELQLQRDMGVLKIDNNGLWQEFKPEGI